MWREHWLVAPAQAVERAHNGRHVCVGGTVAARASGVLTLCGARSVRTSPGVLVSWCHGANVAAPQCTHTCARRGRDRRMASSGGRGDAHEASGAARRGARASERGPVLLVSWLHGANVAAPQCTHLREGAEGARAGESVIGQVRGGGTRPAAAWRAAWARGAGRGAAAAERSRAFAVSLEKNELEP